MTVVNNSSTEYYANGGSSSWYTYIDNKRYSNSGLGYSSITVYWKCTKHVRYTVEYGPGSVPESEMDSYEVNLQKTENVNSYPL